MELSATSRQPTRMSHAKREESETTPEVDIGVKAGGSTLPPLGGWNADAWPLATEQSSNDALRLEGAGQVSHGHSSAIATGFRCEFQQPAGFVQRPLSARRIPRSRSASRAATLSLWSGGFRCIQDYERLIYESVCVLCSFLAWRSVLRPHLR